MNLAISQDEQDLVNLLVFHLGSILVERLEYRPEVGGASKFDRRQLVPVDCLDLTNAIDARVRLVSIQSEAVLNLLSTRRNSSKTERREVLIVAVWFQNLAHFENSPLILIRASNVVERTSASRMPVRGCEVNGNCERYAQASLEVIHKGGNFDELKVCEFDSSLSLATVRGLDFIRALVLQHVCGCDDVAHFLTIY